MTARTIRTLLGWSWWLVMPPFACLVLRLDVERMCAAPFDVLPGTTTVPLLAWALSGLYLAAHAWLGAAWLATALHADALVPPWRIVRDVWGPPTWRGGIWVLSVTILVFALEHGPILLWRVVGRVVLHCG